MGTSTPPSSRIVIAGGSGYLGVSLARHLLATGKQVTLLSRHAPKAAGAWTHVKWDARSLADWVGCLENADALVNLAGRSVDCIKTPDHCDEILRSRVESTLALGRALSQTRRRPRVWVQMSTAHIYGDPPAAVCDEDSATGFGLAPDVGRAWEAAFSQSLPPDMRAVVLRTSFVLGREGGALPRLITLARFGLGGRIGSGRQGMSWIHEHDMNRLFDRAISDDSMNATYVATAPNPVLSATFMRELRRAVGMPLGLPAPAFLVRLGAPLVMRTDPELALYGRFCVSKRLREEGFTFKFPTLDATLSNLFAKKNTPARTN